MPELALLGVGSNLGDRNAHLGLAVASLSKTPGVTVTAVSAYHETRPVGGPSRQGAFLNAAVAAETTLDPDALLGVLNSIEARAGRVRRERWGERTLDLDILLLGDRVVNTPRLQIPHPRMALRRFVLAPLAEIAGGSVDPVTRRTVAASLANLDRRPSYLAFAAAPRWAATSDASGHPGPDDRLVDELVQRLPATPLERTSGSQPGLAFDPDAGKNSELGSCPVARFRADAEATSRVLDRGYWQVPERAERWLVSRFWFDALFLDQPVVKNTRPPQAETPPPGFPIFEHHRAARERALPPTFVVARPCDLERLGVYGTTTAWYGPVGHDTPVLLVDDFHSSASLDSILTACSASRGG